MHNGKHSETVNSPAPAPTQATQPDITAFFHYVFTSQELDFLEQIALVVKESGDVNGPNVPEPIRRCAVGHVNPHELIWAADRLCNLIGQANMEHFRFSLHGFMELFQFVRYDAAVQGKYDWHVDMRPDFSRKLSVSVQLSREEDYEGGELDIMVSAGQVNTMPKMRGTVILFPSYVMHRVRPVTRGTRCSLVAWVGGEPFK